MYAYPGNAGMENDGCMIVDSDIRSWKDCATWCLENEIDLVIIGPEKPLDEGAVDIFTKAGIRAFGPVKKAAEIEGSKAFSKMLMKKYDIPTAPFQLFTDASAARAFLQEHGVPCVIKVSGLAQGKGAFVCNTAKEADDALTSIFDKREFGESGSQIIIEDKLKGQEASIFVLTDGKDYKLLPSAQDHKQIFDDDTGPNTGGMGAYSPVPFLDEMLLSRIETEIIQPTLNAMAAEGRTYRGLLYIGLMIDDQGPKVIEYNCRFGDPETEAILPLVECDWYELFYSCTNATLSKVNFSIRPGYCVSIVLASGGYPGHYEKGKVITGIEDAERSKSNVDVYHAGTGRNQNEEFITAGGRVLAVTVWDSTLSEAVHTAYENIALIRFEGMHYRRDIGKKGIHFLTAVHK